MKCLKVFGLLNCSNDPLEDKIESLHELVKKGNVKDDNFTVDEFQSIFEQICAFAVWDLFAALAKFGKTFQIYNEDECRKLKENVAGLQVTFLELASNQQL
mgnify:CR=1 FL=1